MTCDRRTFLRSSAPLGVALFCDRVGSHLAWSQDLASPAPALIQTPTLNIAYEDNGSKGGFPLILLHGFPDDVRAWDEVTKPLIMAGYRTLVPYLRGYGPTRFREMSTPRMAEQAAIGQDLLDFADALKLDRFAVAGYDWGGRAAAIAAVLRPDRVRAAVLIGGYTIQNTVAPSAPADPETERQLWYQWYFNTERGRAGLMANRRGVCRLLWETWSPGWHFSDATFNRTAPSFENPDFVDVVIHSYRHRLRSAPGEPRFMAVEAQLAQHPKISVPSIVLYGANDVLRPVAADPLADQASFSKLVGRTVVAGAGHFMPREKPDAVSSAMLNLLEQVR